MAAIPATQTRKRPRAPKKTDNPAPKKLRAPRQLWDLESEELLLAWLELDGIYDSWKGAAMLIGSDGRKRKNTGRSKTSICQEGVQFLTANGVGKWDQESVRLKIKSLEVSWRNARTYLSNTGAGLMEEDKLEIPTISAKVRTMCPHFDRMDALMRDRPSSDPSHVSGSTSGTDLPQLILLGDFLPKSPESVVEDGSAHDPFDDDAIYAAVNTGEKSPITHVSDDQERPEPRANEKLPGVASKDDGAKKSTSVTAKGTPPLLKQRRVSGGKEELPSPKAAPSFPEAMIVIAQAREKAADAERESREKAAERTFQIQTEQLVLQRDEFRLSEKKLELKMMIFETQRDEAKAALVAAQNRQAELELLLRKRPDGEQ